MLHYPCFKFQHNELLFVVVINKSCVIFGFNGGTGIDPDQTRSDCSLFYNFFKQ
ncbi:hypothetical protein Q7C_1363 [Methylophaga frappieri]|uniref:Uncharacterized protein n=1 Tax=Methylophaga frappieri (strain ATCC BAA-2434 / DSM 25690 / JAM7) TaxID=754477 RepID=I1YHX0_METFJ|nr:hypothetical protein Q7C_1363 [Methylophaga frappieri]